jgi:hypothetical protein
MLKVARRICAGSSSLLFFTSQAEHGRESPVPELEVKVKSESEIKFQGRRRRSVVWP